MALGIGSIVKLARGGMGPDELMEVLSAAGIELEFSPRPVAKESFAPLAAAASLPSSKLIELKGKMKNGDGFYALLVMVPFHKGL